MNEYCPLPYKAKEARHDAGLLSLVFHVFASDPERDRSGAHLSSVFAKKIWGRPKPPPLLSSPHCLHPQQFCPRFRAADAVSIQPVCGLILDHSLLSCATEVSVCSVPSQAVAVAL